MSSIAIDVGNQGVIAFNVSGIIPGGKLAKKVKDMMLNYS